MADASIPPEPLVVPESGPSVLCQLARRKLALLGLLIIVICVGGAMFARWLAPFDPYEQFFDGLTIEGAPLPPNEAFWFGTDLLGRDLFSRILYGAQTSLVIGLDVARYGDDDTVAAPRRGRKAYELKRFASGDGPTTAAAFLSWLAGSGIRRTGEIAQVNVDVIGIGASVFDCLAGEGFTHDGVDYKPRTMVRAVGVNSSQSPTDTTYANLRAELHFLGRAWLADGGALPDDAKLQAEALAPKYRMDARGRLLVSLKDDIRALIGRSPDACDAWLLSLFEVDEFVPPTPPAPPPYDDSRELGAFASR